MRVQVRKDYCAKFLSIHLSISENQNGGNKLIALKCSNQCSRYNKKESLNRKKKNNICSVKEKRIWENSQSVAFGGTVARWHT